MSWSPSATATAVEASFRSKLADVSITAAETYMPKALTDALVPYVGTVNGHSLGTVVSWASGTGAGQISFGAAAPNGTLGSATGCDEGGTITMTTGANTSTGALFVVHFAAAFPSAPAGMVFAADSATGTVMFNYQFYVTSTTTTMTLNASSALPNATYKWHWIAKGST